MNYIHEIVVLLNQIKHYKSISQLQAPTSSSSSTNLIRTIKIHRYVKHNNTLLDFTVKCFTPRPNSDDRRALPSETQICLNRSIDPIQCESQD